MRSDLASIQMPIGGDRRRLMVAALLGALPSRAVFAKPSHQARVLHVGGLKASQFGSGPDVLLLCGLAGGANVWEKTVAQLAPRFRVHVLQWTGLDREAAQTRDGSGLFASGSIRIRRYVGSAHVVAPLVIGHSAGGVMALKLLAETPAFAKRAMLVDAVPAPGVLLAPPGASAEDIRNQAAELFDRTMKAAAAERAAILHAEALEATQDGAAAYRIAQEMVRADRRKLGQDTRELSETDLRGILPSITIPLTVVFADQASLGAPPGWMRKRYEAQYVGMVSKVRFVEVTKARHYLMLDQPEAFAAAVRDFVDGRR